MKKHEIYREMHINELWKFINKFYDENGFVPTTREICQNNIFQSTSTAFKYLNYLEARGLIKRKVKGGSYAICKK